MQHVTPDGAINKTMETPTVDWQKRLALIAAITSLILIAITWISGAAVANKQVEDNTKSIQEIRTNTATKEDIHRLERTVDETSKDVKEINRYLRDKKK